MRRRIVILTWINAKWLAGHLSGFRLSVLVFFSFFSGVALTAHGCQQCVLQKAHIVVRETKRMETKRAITHGWCFGDKALTLLLTFCFHSVSLASRVFFKPPHN